MQENYSSPEFEREYTYCGTDLGASVHSEAVFFRLWAPSAHEVTLRLYKSGNPHTDDLIEAVSMHRDIMGTWVTSVGREYMDHYYDYLVTVEGISRACCDPYARTTGANGQRAMIFDAEDTDPEGWSMDSCCHHGTPITDHIIYEVHIRDLTVHPSSAVVHKGKYLGLCERGTSLPDGTPTALDHILNLGVTHVQLQPIYDFGSVDETGDLNSQYNWGYDPINYNVPEGSYSTDPFNGKTRVRELKTLIKTLHENGLGVYMDVVYNHVYDRDDFCFNRIVPGYFSRPGSNGSGCGNDTASERSMVRKYIIDSLYYWVREYHIDGFRFDLAGLIDAQTIREAIKTIRETHPWVQFYGEGWHMSSLVTKPNTPMADQTNSGLIPEFGFFNDCFRDLLRGSVFDAREKGFLTGKTGNKNALRSCFMGLTPWACSPCQSINYISCHDNHTLFDRLSLGLPRASKEDISKRCRLGAAFSLLAQGVPFFLAGEEILRSKPLGKGLFDENSYRSPDSVNAIRWSDLENNLYSDNLKYYKGLIAFRKKFKCLRQVDRDHVVSSIKPVPCADPHTLIFRLHDEQEKMIIIFNNGTRSAQVPLSEGVWGQYINDTEAGTMPICFVTGSVKIPPLSAAVLIQDHSTPINVVAAMICKNGKILLCQRPSHKSRAFLWEFPGGKTEAGETDEEALIRECSEELGVALNVMEKAAQVCYSYPDISIHLSLFRCALADGEPAALEHNAICWVSPDEISGYPLAPADYALWKILH